MSPKDLKYQFLNRYHQVIIFDLKGNLLGSCNSMIDLDQLPNQNVFDQWPVLESVRPALSQLEELDIPFRLPAVELSLPELKGIFDFEFSVHPEQPEQIIWLLIDQTRIYRYFRRIQQERNMLLLEKEYRETGRSIKVSSALDS
ncbi:MAG: hypothetical protein AAFN10_24760 [Bacteroidota bacterium]